MLRRQAISKHSSEQEDVMPETVAPSAEWDSMEEYAQQLGDDIGLLADMADELAPYFARDLLLGGEYWTADAGGGCVFVFVTL